MGAAARRLRPAGGASRAAGQRSGPGRSGRLRRRRGQLDRGTLQRACPGGRLAEDIAAPRRQLDDEDIELLLGGPVAPVAPPAAARLDEVEVGLRQVREEVQAAAPHAAARAAAAPRPVAAPDGPALGQASADAIAQLGVDIARLVDVVDCGFERLEAAGAKQAADLRTDVAQMLDDLAGRLGAGRPIDAAKADVMVGAEPAPTVAWDDLDAEPLPTVAWDELDAEPAPTLASGEPDTEPPPTAASNDPDADLFDEPADFASITTRGRSAVRWPGPTPAATSNSRRRRKTMARPKRRGRIAAVGRRRPRTSSAMSKPPT